MLIAAFALAVALAMDAFAVALTHGARARPGLRDGAAIALAFGLFQGGMPLIGWLLGALAMAYIASVDHWIALALLAGLGLHMIFAKDDGDSDDAGADTLRPNRALSGTALLVAAFATSVDALAAGITLPSLALPPVPVAGLIAAVTTGLSAAGLLLGRVAGERFGQPAEILGGLLLIALGVSIAWSHVMAG